MRLALRRAKEYSLVQWSRAAGGKRRIERGLVFIGLGNDVRSVAQVESSLAREQRDARPFTVGIVRSNGRSSRLRRVT
jgi:hypothetical protein